MENQVLSVRGQFIARAKSLVKCGRMRYSHYKTFTKLLTGSKAEANKTGSVYDMCLAVGMHDVVIKP